MDNFIINITGQALGQIFWFFGCVLKSKFFGANTNAIIIHLILSIMRQIDVNRVTRYSLNLSQSVRKFIFNHLYVLCFNVSMLLCFYFCILFVIL